MAIDMTVYCRPLQKIYNDYVVLARAGREFPLLSFQEYQKELDKIKRMTGHLQKIYIKHIELGKRNVAIELYPNLSVYRDALNFRYNLIQKLHLRMDDFHAYCNPVYDQHPEWIKERLE